MKDPTKPHMRKMQLYNAALIVVFFVSSAMFQGTGWGASTLNITRDHQLTQQALSLGLLDISGADMGNLLVTALFNNNTQEAISWDASLQRATGTNWALAQSGDTKSNPWTLFNNSGVGLIALLLDGVPGNVVFDVVPDNKGSNPNDPSGFGTPFTVRNDGGVQQVDAKYWKPVGMNEVNQFSDSHDLYGGLRLDFSGPLADGRVFSFLIDTDLVTFPAPPIVIPPPVVVPPVDGGGGGPGLPPGTNPIPEPQTVILFGTGLLGLLAAKRFRKSFPA